MPKKHNRETQQILALTICSKPENSPNGYGPMCNYIYCELALGLISACGSLPLRQGFGSEKRGLQCNAAMETSDCRAAAQLVLGMYKEEGVAKPLYVSITWV